MSRNGDIAGPHIRIVLLEDQAIVRAGIRVLLESRPGLEVIAEASTPSEILDVPQRLEPDVLLFGVDLAPEDALDLFSRFKEAFPASRILILTASPDSEIHWKAVSAGAAGVVLKEQAPETLFQAIHAVHSGEIWLSRSLTAAVLSKLARPGASTPKADPESAKIAALTNREREIVTLIGEGRNGAAVAERLGISEATVRNHLTSILGKLELSNKFELAVYAFRHGLAGNIAPGSQD